MYVDSLPSSCAHENHLFNHPLCSNQTLLKKIANIAFHILTIGIPLAVYHIAACIFSRTAPIKEYADLQTTAVRSFRMPPTPSPVEKAFTLAQAKLREHANLLPTAFRAGWNDAAQTHQPVNRRLPLLNTLYWEITFKNFEDTFKRNRVNPWRSEEVINAADACMKISYTISVLTLDDLAPFITQLAIDGETRSYAEALTRQDSYQYRTFFYCTTIYHYLRGGVVWRDNPWNENQEGLYFPDEPVSDAHAELFYRKGSLQNSWNTLYNDFCGRVRQVVTERKLTQADARHVNWTQKDTGSSNFTRVPDTQPS
jgi:hypothetical protein